MHGLSIPLGKLGFFLPRTLSRAFTVSQGNDDTDSFQISDRIRAAGGILRDPRRRRSPSQASGQSTPTRPPPAPRPIFKIGGAVIRDPIRAFHSATHQGGTSTPPAVAAGRTIRFPDDDIPASIASGRMIRFPDEERSTHPAIVPERTIRLPQERSTPPDVAAERAVRFPPEDPGTPPAIASKRTVNFPGDETIASDNSPGEGASASSTGSPEGTSEQEEPPATGKP